MTPCGTANIIALMLLIPGERLGESGRTSAQFELRILIRDTIVW